MKKYRINEKKFNKFIGKVTWIAAIIIIIGLIISSLNSDLFNERDIIGEMRVTIEDGDTLWSLSRSLNVCPDDMDIRLYIDIVKDYNDLEDSNIDKGDMIIFPILAEK